MALRQKFQKLESDISVSPHQEQLSEYKQLPVSILFLTT